MVKKILTYIILILGVIFLILGLNIIKINFPQNLSFLSKNSLIIGIILVVIAIIFIFQKSKIRKKTDEVPIYKGEEIVGYRVK